MVYLRREVTRHTHECLTEDGEDYFTIFASIRYWTGKDWGRVRPYHSNESEAVEVSQTEAEDLLYRFYTEDAEDESYASAVSYFIVDSAVKPTKEEWERLY